MPTRLNLHLNSVSNMFADVTGQATSIREAKPRQHVALGPSPRLTYLISLCPFGDSLSW